MSGVRPAALLDSFKIAVHEITATPAVNMNVDETRADPTMMLRKCLFVILLTLVPLIKSEAGKLYYSNPHECRELLCTFRA